MIILIDENVKRIDKKVMRVSVCCVEVDNENILDDIRGYVNSIKDDRIRFGSVDKIHFSSMSEAQRQSVIEYISKINITAKIFIYYYDDISEHDAKLQSAEDAVLSIKHIHRGKKLDIKLEEASEYKSSRIAKYCLRGEDLFIVPDGILSVFLGCLDNVSNRTGANDRMYILIKEKIRLQVFSFGGEKEYLNSIKRV